MRKSKVAKIKERNGRLNVGLTDAKELAQWRELATKVIMQEYPILPQPKWGQDVAFVAFTIDKLRQLREP